MGEGVLIYGPRKEDTVPASGTPGAPHPSPASTGPGGMNSCTASAVKLVPILNFRVFFVFNSVKFNHFWPILYIQCNKISMILCFVPTLECFDKFLCRQHSKTYSNSYTFFDVP